MPSDYDKICRDNIRRRGEEFDDIGQLISEQLYSDRSHFVYELLQNAEDALERRFRLNPNDSSPCKVQFRLFQDRLEFRHFGAPFNEEDVRGISDVLKGTKKEDFIQIGKFGIGFKSVYAFTASPEIHSGEEHFVIKRYIRPEAKDPDFLISDCETVFNFPFDHKELTVDNAFSLILNKLRGLGPRVLLFLRRIDEIVWSVEPDGEKGQYLKKAKEDTNYENARCVTVIDHKNRQDDEEKWLIFERPVSVPDGRYQVRVEIGLRLETNLKDGTERIARVKEAPLVAYFPTEKYTRLGLLIQGPYRTKPSRDNIPKDDDWNKKLIAETAQLVVELLRQLKEMALLSVSLLEALPIRMEDFPVDSMFYPIVVAVRKALMDEDLLPADDGTFVSARNAKLARGADLRKLLNHDQLCSLFQSTGTIKWLSGTITQDRTPDLHTYLLNELDVEEVTPDSFARKITQSFLVGQTDEWFIEFYGYLSDQEALWRSPRWSGDTGGLLRAKPILRLQDDSQVAPFRSDGTTPNAFLPPPEETDFPIVKRSIVNNEQVGNFLKRLVLSEPDVFDDIVERVLPKYINADVSSIPQHEHVADIQKILRAMGSDSEAGKKKVVRAARQTPFLKAVDRSGGAAFKKPGGIYLPTHQLTDYFLGSPGGWFLNETEGEQEWHELGVAKKPRFKRILIDLAWDEKSRLRGNQGHTRDIETIDYDLDGLDNFLARFPADQQFKRYSLIVWNFLLQHLKESSYYRFYEGEYRWFYYQERSACFDATWMKRLRSHAWMPKNGTDIPHKPGELSLSDLPEQFERNEKLADLLGIKKDVVAKLAEAAGIPIEDIDLLKRYPEEFSQWKAQVAAQNERPEFPTRTVRNPERRQERLTEELTDALEKEYEPRVRSVRITEATPYTRTWLRNQYTNDAGQMVCQICKEEMPFKKPDDQYYFEAVEIIKQLHIEREELFLALCPTCAAKYKVFVKNDKERTDKLIESILGMEGLEIPVQLDKFRASIHFVEAHLDDLKIILLQSKSIGDGRTKSSETELKLPLVSASTQGELVAERKSQPKVIYKKKGVSAEDPKELVQCPHCPQGAPPVRADRLAKHIRRVHGIAPDQTFFGSAVVSPKIVRRKTRRKKSFKGPIGSGVRRCRICGTPAVPGSDYCYGCG